MKRSNLAPALSLATTLILTALPSFSSQLVLDGNITQNRVHELTSEIQWNTQLNSALMEARREGKMVFWVHMLGNMSGAT